MEFSKEELLQELQRRQSQDGFANTLGRGAGMVGRALASGVAGLANLPQLASNIGAIGGRYVGEKLRGEKIPTAVEQYPYPSEKAKELIDKLSGGKFAPKTFGERAASSAVEFAGGGGLGSLAARGLGKAIPAFLPQTVGELAPLAGAGIGAEAGQELLPEHPALGALGGALLGGKVGSVSLKRPSVAEKEFFNREGNLEQAVPMEQAGGLIKKGAAKYREIAGEEASKLFGAAENLIDENARIPLSKTSKTIEASLGGKTAQHESLLRESPAGKLLGRIRADILQNDGHLPYETAKLYKDELSDLITTHGQLGNKAQGRIKHIEGILEREIKDNLKSTNPKGYEALSKANEFYSSLSSRDRDIFNMLIKEETPTGAFKSVLSDVKRADADKMEVAMKHLAPDHRAQLSATMINELGKNNQNEFITENFFRSFNGLEPNAQKIVLSGLPKASQDKFIELAGVGEGPGRFLTEGAAGVLGAQYGGLPGLLAGLVAGNIPARLIGAPSFINSIYRASKIRDLGKQKSFVSESMKQIKQTHPELKQDIDKFEHAYTNPEQASSPQPEFSREELEAELQRRALNNQ
jgi:hypothetical protein